MIVIQRLFSKKIDKYDPRPTRPKSESNKVRHTVSILGGSLGLCLSPNLYNNEVLKERKAIESDVSRKIMETVEKAKEGNPKALEHVIKISNDSTGFNRKLDSIIEKSPRLRKAKLMGAAKAAIPVALVAYGFHGLNKTYRKNEKANKEYKRQLRNWKNRNKEKIKNDTKKK